MEQINTSKILFNSIGCTITILKYYGNSFDAREFMSIACKSIREHWKEWENEICSFLSKSDTVIWINHFNKKIRNHLVESDRYQDYKLDISFSSNQAVKRFIESIKYFKNPQRIKIINFKAKDDYFKSHPSSYLKFWRLFSKSKPMPYEFNDPKSTPYFCA